MKRVVQIDRPSKLIIGGPWIYADDYAEEGDFVLESWAQANGYKPGPPEPLPVPVSVPAWALQAILEERGKLTKLQAAIDSMTGATGHKVQWIFRRGDMFERDGDTVNSLGASIGLTPAQVDDLFRDANQLATS